MWKNIYFECLSSGKHFLEQVLVSSLHQFGKFDLSLFGVTGSLLAEEIE